MQFSFDAGEPIEVIVFLAKPIQKEPVFQVTFPSGLCQNCQVPFSPDTAGHLRGAWTNKGNVELILELRRHATETGDSVQAQVSHIAIQKLHRNDIKAEIMRQELRLGGSMQQMLEMYGQLGGASSGEPCVVCLGELSDSVVLPCRHLCLCAGCAQTMQARDGRCPICRAPSSRVLRLDAPC